MSLILSTPEQIFNAPTNSSPAKQLYSFPKAKRFREIIVPTCQKAFYEVPSTITKRAASIGYGSKLNFTQISERTPSPMHYQLPRLYETDRDKARGVKIGTARIDTHSSMIDTIKVPGPGSYNYMPMFPEGSKYSMRMKTPSPDPLDKRKISPGPGSYKTIGEMNTTGKYLISKYHDSSCAVIRPPDSGTTPRKSARGSQESLLSPGPGTYFPKLEVPNAGLSFLSKYPTTHGRTFSSAPRVRKSPSQATPGPGEYVMPSEFGHYGPGGAERSPVPMRGRRPMKAK